MAIKSSVICSAYFLTFREDELTGVVCKRLKLKLITRLLVCLASSKVFKTSYLLSEEREREEEEKFEGEKEREVSNSICATQSQDDRKIPPSQSFA